MTTPVDSVEVVCTQPHLNVRNRKMKRKLISIALLIIPVLILLLSLTGIVMGYPTTEYGFPAYALETHKNVETPVFYISHVSLTANFLWMFIILSIPVFFSGFLWAKSKNIKLPNQSSDPT